jgi:hypothetical protein
MGAARNIAWIRRCMLGEPIDFSCLRVGPAYIVHLPGESFVEYQLAAAEMRPDAFVCVAAYGEYGSGYIGTAAAYDQGGYEDSPRASKVAPEVEDVLLPAIKKLLE